MAGSAMHVLTAFAVNYGVPLRAAGATEYRALAQRLMADLPPKWDLSYRDMCPRATNILAVVERGMFFHFDLASELRRKRPGETPPDDRVVVVYGLSRYQFEGRDDPRIKAFLRGGFRTARGRPLDKGHFGGHRKSGLDINLFPERPEVYRGWSPRDNVFREMERYCVAYAGTFFFARPIYGDSTWTPHAIEYGILKQTAELWVERFVN